MSRVMVLIFAMLFLSSGASADEPHLSMQQCRGLYLGLSQIADALDSAEHDIGPLNWDFIAHNVSTGLTDATASAKDAEAHFFTALREYKVAITRLTNETQLCR